MLEFRLPFLVKFNFFKVEQMVLFTDTSFRDFLHLPFIIYNYVVNIFLLPAIWWLPRNLVYIYEKTNILQPQSINMSKIYFKSLPFSHYIRHNLLAKILSLHELATVCIMITNNYLNKFKCFKHFLPRAPLKKI